VNRLYLSGLAALLCACGPLELDSGDDDKRDLTPGGDDSGEGCDERTFFEDADGDGYGDSAATLTACEEPEGASDVGGDCDDSDPDVTVCRTAGDADLKDESDAVLVGEGQVDMAGYTVAHAGDLNGDGFGDVLTATNQAYPGVGGVYVVMGPISGERSLSTADATVRLGDDGPELGVLLRSASLAGDLSGDGTPDLCVADYTYSADADYQGRIWVMDGPLSGESELMAADATITGRGASRVLGTEIVRLDLDGDGQQDLLAASAGDITDPSNPGMVEVYRGPLSGSIDAPDQEILGDEGGDGAGAALLAEDLDGDGFDDLVVGARTHGGGALYVLDGPRDESVIDLSYADAVVHGYDDDGRLGEELASAGDLDGDGLPELLATAPYTTTDTAGMPGAVYALSGPFAGSGDVSTALATLSMASTDNAFLYTASTHADLDMDGAEDLLISSGVANNYDGTVFLRYGPVSGAVALDAGGADATFQGDEIVASYLFDLDAGGDVDADGMPDLLVGAANSVGATSADTSGGRAHLLYGGIR